MLLTKTITKFSNVIGHQQPDLRVMRPRCCHCLGLIHLFSSNKYAEIFAKTTNCTRSTGLCNFVVIEKFTLAY